MPASSRTMSDLHPELATRWRLSAQEFAKQFPNQPAPFLTCTYRNNADQQKSYDQGRTKPGKIVTQAKPGQSLHNYYPSLAFDIAFKANGQVSWDVALFAQFAGVARNFGLAWGGDWQTFKDYPHFQPPNFTWQQAANGDEPVFPSLP